MSEEGADNGKSWPNPLKIAVTLTVVYLSGCAFYAYREWTKIIGQDPNNLGDTLAGAFAPLALLWLAVAVFLQKDELAAQRQELKASRLALELQGRELAASVEQFTIQNKIFSDDISQQNEEKRLNQLEIDLKNALLLIIGSKFHALNFEIIRIADAVHCNFGLKNREELNVIVHNNGPVYFFDFIYNKLKDFENDNKATNNINFKKSPRYELNKTKEIYLELSHIYQLEKYEEIIKKKLINNNDDVRQALWILSNLNRMFNA